MKAEDARTAAKVVAAGKREQIRQSLATFQDVGRELTVAVKKTDGDMTAAQLEAAIKAVAMKADEDLKAAAAEEKKAIEAATATEQRSLKAQWTEDEKVKIREKAETGRKTAKAAADLARDVAKRKGERQGGRPQASPRRQGHLRPLGARGARQWPRHEGEGHHRRRLPHRARSDSNTWTG